MKKGSFKNMKKLNKKNILALIKEEQSISRAEIADKLDISRATVTNIVKELIDTEIVRESRQGKSSGGRRPMLLNLNPSGAYVIGLEWGIDSIKAVMLNLEAEILSSEKFEIKSNSLFEYRDISFKIINKFIQESSSKKKIIGVGVGIHGLVDPEEGLSLFTPHFKWGEVNIREILANKIDLAIFLDNDVRMMAEGEIWQGRDDFIFINTGSGVGSALVLNGKMRYGNNNSAGELGHIKISDRGPLCSCGKRGCLEALTSKKKVLQDYETFKAEIKAANTAENISESKLGNDNNIDFAQLMLYFEQNEQAASKALNKMLDFFSRGIADVVNLLNPKAVVLGGFFAEYDNILIPKLKNLVFKTALEIPTKNLQITAAYYGEMAGSIGAAEKVLNRFFALQN